MKQPQSSINTEANLANFSILNITWYFNTYSIIHKRNMNCSQCNSLGGYLDKETIKSEIKSAYENVKQLKKCERVSWNIFITDWKLIFFTNYWLNSKCHYLPTKLIVYIMHYIFYIYIITMIFMLPIYYFYADYVRKLQNLRRRRLNYARKLLVLLCSGVPNVLSNYRYISYITNV